MNKQKGQFVVICGMNNLGKTTVINGLMEYLKAKDKDVVFLKYPIYDLEPTGPRINKYLRGGNPEKLTSDTLQEIYVQNRKDFEPQLISMLEQGKLIIAEDYVGTGIVWGMLGGASLERMEKLNEGLKETDLTILLDGERFLTGIETGHTHESAMELWSKGRQIHLDLAAKYGWKIVKANQTREQVLKDVVTIVDNYGQNI
jgi:thymidylate kinase